LLCRPYGPTSSPLAREEQHSLGGFHQLRRGEKKKTDAIALDMCLDKHIFGCPSSSSFLFSIVFHFDVFVCFPTINTCVPAAQLKVDRAARRRTDLRATDVPAARRERPLNLSRRETRLSLFLGKTFFSFCFYWHDRRPWNTRQLGDKKNLIWGHEKNLKFYVKWNHDISSRHLLLCPHSWQGNLHFIVTNTGRGSFFLIRQSTTTTTATPNVCCVGQ
jgi:hypothetical protein